MTLHASKLIEYITCPSCQRDRRTLAVYINNVKCHACGYYSREHELLTHTVPTAKEAGVTEAMSVTLPSVEPFDWVSKCIPSHVLDLYGVGMDTSGRVVSPHYSPDMQLLAYHTRTPGERDFRMHGSNSPVGLHTLGNNKELIICEGHSDTYSAKVLFPKCDVIGIPGSDTVNTLTPYLSRIRKYRRITVITDGDSAGRKCGDALVELLPRSKTYRVNLAEGMDVSEYLVSDRHEDISTLYKLATANKGGRFVTDEDCDKYATSPMYDAVSTGIKGLDAIMGGGVGVAELTVLFGYTGTGKSALAQQIAINAAKSGVKVMYIAGEMTPKQNLDRLVRQWFGGIVKRDELADHYKQVVSAILITKFGDLTLSNVTDTIHEGILDHGVRLVIVDVLSDVVGFINADVTQPANIIKELHKAVKGTDEDIAPCALLCVAHTKGTDNNEPELDDIRGGSVIKQEAECAIAIVEEKRGDLRNTNRILKLRKKPRNRDFEPDDVVICYDVQSKRYTTPETPHAIQDSTDLRLTPRRSLSLSTPSPSVPSEGDIPVGDSTQAETIRVPDELSEPSTEVTVSTASESVQPGLLLSTDEHVHRDEGNTQAGGPSKVPASAPVTYDNTVQVSGTTDEDHSHTGTGSTTGQSQPGTEDGRLDALRAMYNKHPEILERHRRIQATNHLVRTQLTTLGLLIQ